MNDDIKSAWLLKRNLRRLRLILTALACAALTPAAEAAPAPQQIAQAGPLKLVGGTVDACAIGYRTYGTLLPDRSNAVLLPTWLTGRTADLDGLIGPGKFVDSTKWYVITVDAIGDGVSCSPSSSEPKERLAFPEFSIGDMVDAQHRLLVKTLGVKHLHAVVGMSMGGMQALQWAVRYPDFASKIVAIVATPQPTGQDLLTWNAQLRSIDESASWRGGDYAEGTQFKTLAALQTLSIWTPDYRVQNTSRAQFSHFLQAQDTANLATFSAVDWYRQLQALIRFNLADDAGGTLAGVAHKITAPMLIVTSKRDHMVNPGPVTALAGLTGARQLVLDSDCGHMAPVCDMPAVSAAIAEFLQ